VLHLRHLAGKISINDFIRAAAIHDVPINIVSGGPRRDPLEALADTAGVDVRFAGEVAPDTVRWSRRVDIIDRQMVAGQGLPNVVLETMACRDPVIAYTASRIYSNIGLPWYAVATVLPPSCEVRSFMRS
jgi:hypothetical protein